MNRHIKIEKFIDRLTPLEVSDVTTNLMHRQRARALIEARSYSAMLTATLRVAGKSDAADQIDAIIRETFKS